MNDHLLSEKVLIEYAKGETLIDRLRGLLDQQKDNWDLAAKNYDSLNSLIVKELLVDETLIKLQFNPERIKSTMADVKVEFTAEQCILCENNLPDQQRFIKYYKEYNFLVNPYPIFKEHFTIVKSKHAPQSIQSYLNDLLLISRDVGERYLTFYNGPKCGASVPYHLHFQMLNKNVLPIFEQLGKLSARTILLSINKKKISLKSVELTKRILFTIESNDAIEIMNCFSVIVNTLKSIGSYSDEPMMNLICVYDNKKWTLVIFLRKKHRPDCYFAEGDKRIVVSPAAVDMSGLIVLPREEDIKKLTVEKILELYREVGFSKEYNEYLMSKLKNFYS